MRRIVVLGTSGSGKTTFARELSQEHGIPHHELDTLFWGPNCREAPQQDFRARVAELAAGDTWIIEGHDLKVRDLTWPRADTMIWLDPPLFVVLKRSLLRAISTRDLESFWWTLKTHYPRRRDWADLFGSAEYPNAKRVRIS